MKTPFTWYNCLSTNKKKLKNLGPGGSSAPLYDIQWEQSDLGDTPIHLFNLYDAMTLHQTVTTSTKPSRISTASVHNPNPLSHEQQRILFRVDDAEIGTPEASDDEDGKDNNDEEDQILFPDILHEYATRQNIPQDEDDSEEPFDGSDFCWSTGTLPPPPDRSTRAASFVKPEAAGSFSTPIDSLLAFVPLSVFNSIAFFSNLYAHHVIESSKNGNVSGKRWEQDLTINEIMKFFGILLKMVLRPTPGQSYPFCWNDAQWHPYTTLMKLRRFQQIRLVLHFNDNSNIDGLKDAALKVRIQQNQKPSCILLIHSKFSRHKVRPLLNCLKITFPEYLELGKEVSLDEASVSCRSRYSGDVIFYNPRKPGGKFHFRFYMLCCSTSYACV